jgi:D-alanyl-D-alanine carboxypeptidase (penicillin-binding protein 5/6)
MLLRGITTVSANDASVVLAEGVAGSVTNWTALMNEAAGRLGMRASRFGTPNGWPDRGGTQVSARDMITLGTALIERHPELYARYFGKKSLTWNGVTGQNYDPILGVVPGADGIKTGHTREAGYNFLGSAVRDGRRIMIVVGGAKSEEQRATAARDLIEWSFQAREALPLFATGALVGQARVQAGEARTVGLLAPGGIRVTVVRGTRPSTTATIRYRGPLTAPIAKGTEVALLEIAVAGQVVNRVPLVAATDIAKAGPFDRLVNGVAGLLP